MLLAFDQIERHLQSANTATLRILQVNPTTRLGTSQAPAVKIGRTEVPAAAGRLQFVNEAKFLSFYVLSQTGFDRSLPAKAITSGFEIVREFVDSAGSPSKRSSRVRSSMSSSGSGRSSGMRQTTWSC